MKSFEEFMIMESSVEHKVKRFKTGGVAGVGGGFEYRGIRVEKYSKTEPGMKYRYHLPGHGTDNFYGRTESGIKSNIDSFLDKK